MNYAVKALLIAGLVTTVAGFSAVAQAGTSRSLGGHSMVNARNCTGSRSFGGHNLGGAARAIIIHAMKQKFQGEQTQRQSQGQSQGALADYIRAHGGTVEVNKGNGQASISVTTGRGGSLNGKAQKTSTFVTNDQTESTIRFTSQATTASGIEYRGNANATAGVNYSLGSPTSAYFSNSKNATILGENGNLIMSSGQSTAQITEAGDSSFQRSVFGISMPNAIEYTGSTTISNTTGSNVLEHQGQITNPAGDVLNLTTIATPVDDQTIKIEHSSDDYSYTMYIDRVFN